MRRHRVYSAGKVATQAVLPPGGDASHGLLRANNVRQTPLVPANMVVAAGDRKGSRGVESVGGAAPGGGAVTRFRPQKQRRGRQETWAARPQARCGAVPNFSRTAARWGCRTRGHVTFSLHGALREGGIPSGLPSQYVENGCVVGRRSPCWEVADAADQGPISVLRERRTRPREFEIAVRGTALSILRERRRRPPGEVFSGL